MRITLVAGARPNFIKIAPLMKAFSEANATGQNFNYRLVHTGQHYDKAMSDTFFEELNIPYPDVNLKCGGGSQAEQTASIMVAFEKEVVSNPADLVIVVGDVTSTMACSIVAKKLCTAVAHVEAGIRSFDLTMPEEINRMVTDAICDYFFTTTEEAGQNLIRTGVDPARIFFVGNIMIDTLLANRPRFQKPQIFDALKLSKNNYIIMTLHRPANVDDASNLKDIMIQVMENSKGMPVLFPMHPRTRKVFNEVKMNFPGLHIIDPLGYLNFNFLVQNAKVVITDSGGITEETTVMGIPCITLRNSTERPETVTIGTNELIGTNPQMIQPALEKLMSGKWKKGNIPLLWDGQTAKRIVDIIGKINA